jgi:hypothetical protein
MFFIACRKKEHRRNLFTFLFIVVHLKVFSVAPVTLFQAIGREVNNDLEMT